MLVSSSLDVTSATFLVWDDRGCERTQRALHRPNHWRPPTLRLRPRHDGCARLAQEKEDWNFFSATERAWLES